MRIVGPILLFSANPENLVILSLSLFLLKILTNLVTLALHVLISLSSAYSAKHGPNADVFCCCNFISSHHEIPLLYIKNLHTPHQHKQTRLPFLFPRFLLNGSTSLVIPNHQAGTFTYWNLRILAVCVVMFSRGNRV